MRLEGLRGAQHHRCRPCLIEVEYLIDTNDAFSVVAAIYYRIHVNSRISNLFVGWNSLGSVIAEFGTIGLQLNPPKTVTVEGIYPRDPVRP